MFRSNYIWRSLFAQSYLFLAPKKVAKIKAAATAYESSDIYKNFLKQQRRPRSFSPAERAKIVGTFNTYMLKDFHPGIAGGFLTSRNMLSTVAHIPPTSINMAWWRCAFCDSNFRRRVFDHCFYFDGQCPSCGKTPNSSTVFADHNGKFLSRTSTTQVFTTKETGSTQQTVPFLATSTRDLAPMLAAGWSDHQKTAYKPDDKVLVSNKLDGIRCIAAFDPDEKEIHFFTRSGTILESCDHLRTALAPLFEKDPSLVLDGELYAHKTFKDFQEVFSAVRTTREHRTPQIEAIQKKLQYHLFDLMYFTPDKSLPADAGFKRRFHRLQAMVELAGEKDKLCVVDNIEMRAGDVDAALEPALKAGYEGVMVRNPEAPYAHGKRKTSLLKHKKMYDSEYEIVHCIEGKGKFTGMIGSFICKMANGKTFAANPAATEVMRKEMWKRRSEYIGQVGTVQYQELTRDNVPRFPVLKCIRGSPNGSNWL